MAWVREDLTADFAGRFALLTVQALGRSEDRRIGVQRLRCVTPTRHHADMSDVTNGDATKGMVGEPEAPVHVAVVLDRSGSMASIADDVVGGFNTFLAEQRTQPGRAAVTLAQFDGQDPFELLVDGVPLAEVTELARRAYQPRGNTPLYDAVAQMLARVDARASDEPDEDQVVVIITDGLENASREHTRDSVLSMIDDRKRRGWSFVFLAADQDAFEAGGRIGMARGSTGEWEKHSEGHREMWQKVSRNVSSYRSKDRIARSRSSERFLEQDASDRPLTPFGRLAGPEALTPRARSYWVVEGRLLAGAYPFRADPQAGEKLLRRLLDAGVTAFVDLTEQGVAGAPDEALVDYRPYLDGAGGVVALRHPIRDLGVPPADQHRVTLDAIDGLLSTGRTVYVHCWGGVGRTGLTVATWLVRHTGCDPVEALHVLDRLRIADRGAGHRPAPETREQREFVLGWSEP